MPPRTLASLAHALTVSATPDEALVALGEALAEVDRFAQLALIRFDERRGMLTERSLLANGRPEAMAIDTTFDHLDSSSISPTTPTNSRGSSSFRRSARPAG
jgi:hypothetical protein